MEYSYTPDIHLYGGVSSGISLILVSGVLQKKEERK